MGQDRNSGAEANKFGREYGAEIIRRLGGEIVKKGANECIIGEDLLTLHCARKNTKSVGVTRLCLERVKGVLGAFEQEDGSFAVLKLSPTQFRENARPTASRGPSAGRVLIARRSTFERLGQVIQKGILIGE